MVQVCTNPFNTKFCNEIIMGFFILIVGPHIRMLVEAVSEAVSKSTQLTDVDFVQVDLGHSFLLRPLLTVRTYGNSFH